MSNGFDWIDVSCIVKVYLCLNGCLINVLFNELVGIVLSVVCWLIKKGELFIFIIFWFNNCIRCNKGYCLGERKEVVVLL